MVFYFAGVVVSGRSTGEHGSLQIITSKEINVFGYHTGANAGGAYFGIYLVNSLLITKHSKNTLKQKNLHCIWYLGPNAKGRSRFIFWQKHNYLELLWTGFLELDFEKMGLPVANFKESKEFNYLEANTAKQISNSINKHVGI